jgi:hypothetical protein
MFEAHAYHESLDSGESSQELSAAIFALIDKWLEDGAFDEAEKLQAALIEINLRRACESAVNAFGGDIEKAIDSHPGLSPLAGVWVVLGSLVLAFDIDQRSGAIGNSAGPILTSEAYLNFLEAVGSLESVPIHDYLFPWVAATIISTAPDTVSARWTSIVKNIASAQPEFAAAVLAKLESRSEPTSTKKLVNMAQFLASRENHSDKDHRKSYERYQAALSARFRDQGFLRFQGGFTDEHDKDVMLTFGDSAMAISFKGGQVIEIPSSEVRYISVGSKTERIHSGFSHTDYHSWTFDVVKTSGAKWRLKKLIGSDQMDLNPMREHLTSLIEAISDHYKVVASGTQEVSESGYRTRVSYGVWF